MNMDKLKTEQEQERQEDHFGKAVFLIILTGISLLFYFLYKGSDSKLEQLFIVLLYGFSVIPITFTIMLSICMDKLNNGFKPVNKGKKSSNTKKPIKDTSVSESNVASIKEHSKRSNKPRKVNSSKNYESCRETVTICFQQKLFSAEDVFDLDQLIDDLLGEHSKVYNSFNYNNDFQKIYTKLKSKKLVEKDYDVILEWCSNIAKEGVING